MQILSPQIDVSETVSVLGPSTNSPMAERLLSPNMVQLDVRAFEAKPTDDNSSKTRAGGAVLLVFLILVMLVANWVFLPNIYSAKETGIVAPKQISPPLRAALEISDVELRKISVNGRKIALVAGHIINKSGNNLLIQQLNIVLRQKDGQNVISWRYRPQQASLKAGASLRFTSKFNTDVKDGSVVEIQFVSGNDR